MVHKKVYTFGGGQTQNVIALSGSLKSVWYTQELNTRVQVKVLLESTREELFMFDFSDSSGRVYPRDQNSAASDNYYLFDNDLIVLDVVTSEQNKGELSFALEV